MKPRGILLAATLFVLAISGLVWFAATQPRVCTTIGYAFIGDIELQFQGEPRTVAACLGEGCIPAPVTRNDDGAWLVPQKAPYLMFDPASGREAPPGNPASVTVRASYAEGHTTTQTLPIPTESRGSGWWNQCPGPFTYLPVQVP